MTAQREGNGALTVRRCSDLARARELHAFTQGVFGVLDINPRYRPLLEQLGLRAVEDFLRLPAVIVCGHRNRHTAHLTLGSGAGAVPAFLKREQATYWRDYVSSLWAGLGWGSRSCREARMLQALAGASFPCPEFIAAGEDDRGRAFLLVRALDGTRELRQVIVAAPFIVAVHSAVEGGSTIQSARSRTFTDG